MVNTEQGIFSDCQGGEVESIVTIMALLTNEQLTPKDTPENRKALERAWESVGKAMDINPDLKRIQNEP